MPAERELGLVLYFPFNLHHRLLQPAANEAATMGPLILTQLFTLLCSLRLWRDDCLKCPN